MSKVRVIACIVSGLVGALLALSGLPRPIVYLAGIPITMLICVIAHWIDERKRNHG